ncbi:uncharacterized protein LOC112638743 isoform X1 [Camponotus floridanus]|uniref:uncharacterized protein LOC112638743 isoform X1 n=2 Tax=Camponotus floridanus TaxID=104421 RepID=UPI000DC692E1|nr:uncharacterized protein LOC112638743 isoform X1 [Camponotus floridanus]
MEENPSELSENPQSDRSEVENENAMVFKNVAQIEQFVIESLRAWTSESGVLSMLKVDNLLKRLSVGFPNMPKSYKTLLKSNINPEINICQNGEEYWYKGVRANLDQLLQDYLQVHKKIIIDINIDGLPLFKSSKLKFWPILGHLVGTLNEPFIIAIYCGKSDPQNIEEYLEKYVTELEDLFHNGYKYESNNYEVIIRNYILDAPARALIKCCKGHSGYAACEKCTVIGEYNNHRITFIDLNQSLRTDESFRNREQPQHHEGTSPLERLGTGLVSQFRLDPMHLLYIGVFKRLLHFWLFVVGAWKLHGDIINLISEVFVFLKEFCPQDFNRKPRSLNDFKLFKATEFRRILLYDGIVAFKNLIHHNIYKHFLLLHSAAYILSSSTLIRTHLHFAEQFIRTFISHSVVIYGKSFVVYNVHSLSHLSKECQEHGTMDNFSAFRYENRLKSIKDSLMSCYKPLQQIARRDLGKEKIKIILDSKPNQFVLSLKHFIANEIIRGSQYRKVIIDNICFRIGTKNSCFKTSNGNVVLLKNIVYRHRTLFFVGCKFQKQEDFYTYPLPSSELGIICVFQLEERRIASSQ